MANTSAAANANAKPPIKTVFSEYRSIKIPEGMDITPYATKKENGRKPAIPILKSKLSMISGTNGPSILVRKEITEKIKKISATMIRLDFIMLLFTVTWLWGRRLQDFFQCSTCLANKIPQNAHQD